MKHCATNDFTVNHSLTTLGIIKSVKEINSNLTNKPTTCICSKNKKKTVWGRVTDEVYQNYIHLLKYMESSKVDHSKEIALANSTMCVVFLLVAFCILPGADYTSMYS